MLYVLVVAWIGLAGASFGQATVGESYEGNPLAIVDVNVVDVVAGTIKPHQVVVVRYGRIDHLKPADGYVTPGWMTKVDGKGRYLIPGLWDAHVHLSFWDEPSLDESPRREPDPEAYGEILAILAGWGVTNVRDMGGDLDSIDEWRRRIESGAVVGPAVLRAGPYVDGPKEHHQFRRFVTSAEEGRRAVVALERRGVDFIKIHSQVPPEALATIAGTARELGLPVAGHVPYGTSIDQLIDLGFSTVEHADSFFISRLGSRQGTFEQWRAAFEWYATAEGRALLRRLADSRTVFVPTLAIFDSDWEGVPEPWSRLRSWYRELAGLAHRSGVRLLAGTDVARKGGPIQPGTGLHQEMEELVEIGLTPAEALRAATVDAAVAFGLDGELGTIEPGKVANLVLLSGNPLEEIGRTRAIEAVVLRGRLLAAGELAALRAGDPAPRR